MRKKRLTVVISHPIQYHAPLYTYATKKNLFDLHVIFHNDKGSRPFFDHLANTMVSYDNHLLDGYSYEFLTTGNPKGFRERISWKFLGSLDERVLASSPDAVYFHGYNFVPHLRAIRKLRNKGIKILYRGENEDVIPRPWWRDVSRESFLKVFLPMCDAILYIGKENREFFLRRGIPESKLFFVPYSADSDFFGIQLSAVDRKKIRRKVCSELNIDPRSVIFINTCKHRGETGREVVSKKPIDLVNAYLTSVLEMGAQANSTLLMVGDGPLNDRLRAIVNDSEVSSVRFTGYVVQSKLRELLLSADYCVDSGQEPWGCVFNEALPAGLGLISSDHVVGWRDMVHIGQNGFVFRYEDVRQLAEVIKACTLNPQWIRAFSVHSKKTARLYSYDTCVDGLNEALNKV